MSGNNPDRVVERDPKTGRVTKLYISPDEARRMVANRRTKEEKAAEGFQAILNELGYSPDNPAPELMKNLAQIAVSQKTGAVSAIGTLLRIAHGAGGDEPVIRLKPGDICPTCRAAYGGLGADLAREIVQRLNAV